MFLMLAISCLFLKMMAFPFVNKKLHILLNVMLIEDSKVLMSSFSTSDGYFLTCSCIRIHCRPLILSNLIA